MTKEKAAILAQLQREILPMQGLRAGNRNTSLDAFLGPVRHAFPNSSFPLAAIHEFISKGDEEVAATNGFISAMLSSMMHTNGMVIWISNHRTIFPPALKSFGIKPEHVIFIDLKKEKEILWAVEESLKCEGLSAVIAELPELDFTASRRLQLAVEKSCVTGFLLRRDPRRVNTTACVTRWQIGPQASLHNGLPGVGFPRWKVSLLKVRNGRPGTWEIEFAGGKFRHPSKVNTIPYRQQQTG